MSEHNLEQLYVDARDRDLEMLPMLPLPHKHDAKGLFEYLKNVSGKEDFIFLRCNYQCDSILDDGSSGEDNIHNLSYHLNRINLIRKNGVFDTISKAKDLTEEAKRRFLNGSLFDEDDEDNLFLMVYLLLLDIEFLNTFPLPIEALDLNELGTTKGAFIRVYSKYFLFYDYIIDKLEKITSLVTEKPQAQSNTKKAGRKETLPSDTFRDLFKEIHKSKYDQIMTLLSNDLPTSVTQQFEELHRPFAIKMSNNYVWNPEVENVNSYVVGMYLACRQWLRAKISQETAINALNKSLDVEISARTPFSKRHNKRFIETYIKPFELIFQNIQ